MKKLLFFAFILIANLALSQGINRVVPKRPSPPKLVNDLADVLTPQQEEALEKKLVAYDDSTSTQIAIVTVQTTGDYDIADVGLEILRQWGVGTKEKNNGIVILAAMSDRKIDIETGYGMEGIIADITARSIIDNDITPQFREGNYYRGFDLATTSIIQAAAGEYKAPQGYRDRRNNNKGISFGKIIVALVILFLIMGMFGGGNRGGGFMSRRGYRGFWGPTIFGTGGGFGGGGWSGGGGFGGGGGGFGGFGGGGGGGGGASGSW